MPMRTSSLAVSLVLGLASSAGAAVETREELVHETTTSVDLELTPETVLCSHADYSANFLKVLIPELASITLLDHQNTDAGAPCVAAGECAPFGDHAPSDILDEADPSETVDITVRAIRVDEIDHEAQTCNTTLRERVDLIIRGVPFAHERHASVGSRPYGDCTARAGGGDEPAPSGGDGKADELSDGEDAPGSAGCAAGGAGGSSAVALVIFGMTVAGFRVSRRSRRVARG
jgi:hypothetical protein